jgi:hypothetical protein
VPSWAGLPHPGCMAKRKPKKNQYQLRQFTDYPQPSSLIMNRNRIRLTGIKSSAWILTRWKLEAATGFEPM